MEINNSEIIVGLDIGTTKVSIIIGRRNQYNKIEILGNGKSVSSGVSRGIVSNIDKTVESIKQALDEVEKKNNISIKEVFVGIAGQHIKSLQHRGEIVRDNINVEIGQQDIDKLKENMFKLITIPGEEVIHVIPQEYTVPQRLENYKKSKKCLGLPESRSFILILIIVRQWVLLIKIIQEFIILIQNTKLTIKKKNNTQ